MELPRSASDNHVSPPAYPHSHIALQHIFSLHIKEFSWQATSSASEQAVELSAPSWPRPSLGTKQPEHAKHSYEELCAKELSSATLNR